jgi:hypothetical protein
MTEPFCIADLPGFGDAWEKLLSKYFQHERLEDLTADEQIWYTVQLLVWAIEDGGLISYYYNANSDHVLECMGSLRGLNQSKMESLVSRVNTLFGNEVPKGIDAVNEALDAWGDAEDDAMIDIDEQSQQECMAVELALADFIKYRFLTAGSGAQ